MRDYHIPDLTLFSIHSQVHPTRHNVEVALDSFCIQSEFDPEKTFKDDIREAEVKAPRSIKPFFSR